jgi:hypothetical protein
VAFSENVGLGIAFVGAGAFTQVVAAMLLRRPWRLMKAGGTAEGVVVGQEESYHSPKGGSPVLFYFPVVEFATRRGELVRFDVEHGRRVAVPIGTRVRVIYDPARPNDAMLASFRAVWLFPALTAALGLPFLAAGVFALW